MIRWPPPLSYARKGNLQTLPRPTAKPITDRKKSSLWDHVTRCWSMTSSCTCRVNSFPSL